MGPHIAAQIWLIWWSEISCKCKNKIWTCWLIYIGKIAKILYKNSNLRTRVVDNEQWKGYLQLILVLILVPLYFIVNGQSSYVWVRYNFKWLTIVENIVSRKCGQIWKCDWISNKCTMKFGRIFQFRVGEKFNWTYLNIVYCQKTATNVRSFFYIGNIQFIC